MRRRRKPLEVSTFPFLAVLLCAMGALILILMVMDRKAKQAARRQAEAGLALVASAAEQTAAARRAELEQKLQESRSLWEKKRDDLHTKLLTEQQALQLEMQQLHEKMRQSAARLQLEQEQTGALKKQIAGSRGRLEGEGTALASARQALAASEKHTEQEKAALVKMTNDLVLLEQALRDLKASRERETQTYSVVPYRGKRGENRRPLYVECSGERVLFHPDKKPLLVQREQAEVRNEVARRVVRQRAQLAAAKLPDQETPYLMLLVRPDGIMSYYAFESALAGLDVQFGYELIDADWVLDFPEENQPGQQPWQTLAKQTDLPPLDKANSADTKVQGVQFNKRNQQSAVFGNSEGSSNATAGASANTGVPGNATIASAGGQVQTPGLGRPVAVGPELGISGGPELGSGTERNTGPRTGTASTTSAGVFLSGNGGGETATGPLALPKLPWETLAGGEPLASASDRRWSPRKGNPAATEPATLAQRTAPRSGESGPGGTAPTGSSSVPSGNPPVDGATASVFPGTNPGAADGKPNVPGTESVAQLPPLAGTPSRNGGTAGKNTGNAPQGNGNLAEGEPASEPGSNSSERPPEGVLRPLPPPPGTKRPPPSMRAARLNGDRDYLVFIECKPNSVILYPSQHEFALAALAESAGSPLLREVQQMIERKQSGARPGELALRPQVRFLVRPETLRAYHLVYPLFNALSVAITRQNLIPEDEVRAIISGN